MFAYTIGSCVCLVVVGFFASNIASNYSYYVSNNVFKHVNKLSLNSINKITIPKLMTVTTNDATQIQQSFRMFLIIFLAAPATLVGGIIVALNDSTYNSSGMSSLNSLL
ncbi:hypothetical protein FACS189459_7150 [Bacilli bacterium]|nr:hypothetical protein FACS189459_7150 [Bacilli bacterium]